MFQKIIDSKSRTFLLFCFSFLAGIAIASYVSIKLSGVFWYFIFLSFAGLIFVFRKDVKSRFVLIVLLLFVLGIGRYEIAFPKDNEKYISYYNGQEFSFVGYISGEPDVRIEDVRYLVGSEESKGKVYVRTQLYPRYKYGDRVKIDCDLAQPEVFDDFRYDMYLANMGVFSICNNPSLEKIEVVRNGTEGVKHAKLYYTRRQSVREIEKIYSRASKKNQKMVEKKKIVKKSLKKS